MQKRILRLFCLLFACLLCLTAGAAKRPSLFLGDGVWAEDALLPLLETESGVRIPAAAFAKMGVTVTYAETLGSLLLEKEDAYLSYNLQFGRVLDESGSITDATVYRYGGALYLAPEAVCEKFALTFETTYAADGYLAARLTNGTETLSFHELLSLHTEDAAAPLPYLYNPTGKTVGGTFLYPMLLRPTVAVVPTLLRAVGTHSMTFVLSPEDLQGHLANLPAIYAAGHTVAYYMDGTDRADPERFAAEMAEANDLLFSLVGKTVRVYVSTEIYNTIPDIEGYRKKSCRMHLVSDDLSSERMIDMALTQSPSFGVYNFSIAADRETRQYYAAFFRRLDAYTHLRPMTVTESSATQ